MSSLPGRVIVLVLCLTCPAAASAACVKIEGELEKRLCDLTTLDHLKRDVVDAEHVAAVARADAEAEREKAVAKEQRIAALEAELAKPKPVRWEGYALAGAGGVVVGVLLAVLFASVGR